MRKIGAFLSFVFVFTMILFATSCSGKKDFKIMFTDYDGTVLYTEQVNKGDMPSYPLAEPTRKADEDYTYTFSEWWPTIEKATEDKIYQAYYKKTLKQEYTITFKNYDGKVLETQTVKEGNVPTYQGTTPEKPHDEYNRYLFNDWNPSITKVTGNATYTATYTSCALDKYLVTFAYEDNTLIKAYQVASGDMAYYDGDEPTMENSDESKYKFIGWNPKLSIVTEDVIYTAQFMAEPLDYTVIINTDGGERLSGDMVNTFKTDKLEANQFYYDIVKDNYKFAGWAYGDIMLFDENGNTLVDLDEIEFKSNISITAKYKEEAYIDITYVAYNGVNNQILDYYKTLPSKYGSGDTSSFYKWNSIAYIDSYIRTDYSSYCRFDGWYEDGVLISENQRLDYYLFEEDVQLECRFTVKAYSLEVKSNNNESGEIMVKNYSDWCDSYKDTYYYGEKIIVVAKTLSSRKFLGWYDAWGTNVSKDEYLVVEVGESYKLTAKWDYFEIKYQCAPGTENENNPTYYTSSTPNIILAEPTRYPFGLSFVKWVDDYYHEITEIDTSELENLTIGAIFEKDPDFNFDLTRPNTVVDAIIPSKGITEIDANAFSDCLNLKSVLIPLSINIVGKNAFLGCNQLAKVYYDGKIEDWLNISFGNEYSNPMYYATEFYLLDANGTVTYNNKKYSLLNAITITNTKSVGNYQFVGFNGLTSITLDENIQSFGKGVFIDSSISSLYYNGTLEDWCGITFESLTSNPMIVSNNIYFFDEDGTVTHDENKYSVIETLTLPENLVTVNAYAFAGCKSIKTLILNENLKTISDSAFYSCTSLEKVTFNVRLSIIGKEAFAECSSLTVLDHSKHVKSLWKWMSLGEDWNRNVPATKIIFSDGSISLE